MEDIILGFDNIEEENRYNVDDTEENKDNVDNIEENKDNVDNIEENKDNVDNTEENKDNVDNTEDIESINSELQKEIDDIEKMLSSEIEDEKDNDNDLSKKLEDTSKIIKKLTNKVSELEIKNAELTKFGDNEGLSPEIIIIKANYDKAMKGDKESLGKIKELLLNDLGLELVEKKQVFLSNEITGSPNIKNGSNESDQYGIIL